MFKSLTVVLLLYYGVAWGQPIYFDSLYDQDSMTERCINVLSYGNGGYQAITTSRHLNSPGGSQLNLYYLDGEGVAVFYQSEYEEQGRFEAGWSLLASDSRHVVYYSHASPNVGFQFALRKVDAEGATLWLHEYGDTAITSAATHAIETRDFGFLLIGQEANSSDGDMHVIKTDSVGNLEWEKSFGGNLFDCGNSAALTEDGGFLILGWTRSYGAGERDFYLIKTDSLGNQQWQRTYGGGGDEGGFGIILLNDGNYLLAGGGSQGSAGSVGKKYKVTPEGEVIWSKTYAYSSNSGNNLWETVELPNGDLASSGLTDRNGNNNSGWLLKTDSLGEVIWQREYDKSAYPDLFYSVLATEDGGFLLSGQAVNEETMSQDAWLLKVDSVGCAYPNCITGVDEVEPTKVMVDVWPNPTADFFNIVFQQQGVAEVHLCDMAGKLLFQKQTTQLREVIDVSALENGLYLLSVLQGEMKTTVKVMVQR